MCRDGVAARKTNMLTPDSFPCQAKSSRAPHSFDPIIDLFQTSRELRAPESDNGERPGLIGGLGGAATEPREQNTPAQMDSDFMSAKLLVPVERIELPTFGLQNRCSTAELNRQTMGAIA